MGRGARPRPLVSAAVVDEDGSSRILPCQHIVGVQSVNGEVVDRGRPRMAGDGGDLDPGAGAGLKPLPGCQVACVQPLVECRNPEGVTVRGR